MNPSDDLNRLAAALSADRPRPASAGQGLIGWLNVMADRQASDLVLVAGEPPILRIDGRILRSAGAMLDGDDVFELVAPELAPHVQQAFARHGIADAAIKVPGLGRFRVNLHRERGRVAATIRRLPTKVPALASLNRPAGTELLTKLQRGLVIVGGATGSG